MKRAAPGKRPSSSQGLCSTRRVFFALLIGSLVLWVTFINNKLQEKPAPIIFPDVLPLNPGAPSACVLQPGVLCFADLGIHAV